MRGYSEGRKRPSGNVSVREDFLEEENIDHGSDGKGLKIGSKEEGESSAFGKEGGEERAIQGWVRPGDMNVSCLGMAWGWPGVGLAGTK